MLIYLDLLFVLNYWIDLLLLITTNLILKFKISKRVFLGAFVGALSTFLFLIDNNLILFIMKIVICLIMQLITNKYKGFMTLIENTLYFYLVSIVLAGTIYLLGIDKLSMKYNYLLLILITPIVLYLYKKETKKLDSYYKERYSVVVIYKKHKYDFNAFLDTGNKLYDPYKKRPINLVYTDRIKANYKDYILVPINTVNGSTILKCLKVDKVIIDNKETSNCLIGLSDKSFEIQDINMILHKDTIGGLN